jgi:hypothetical protein
MSLSLTLMGCLLFQLGLSRTYLSRKALEPGLRGMVVNLTKPDDATAADQESVSPQDPPVTYGRVRSDAGCGLFGGHQRGRYGGHGQVRP